ncbi:tryptophan 2,3-dioxygenase [Salinactinospora qingdaonensis]|uniref:tryptophan 2,3-dioxygenase n=1 Tax=Salinactinospora qingdaonensis TaxID=702744 RepID=UPI0031F16A1B
MTTYSAYLALDELLSVQRPISEQHDEMLFIVVHQAHELWFKQLLHEFVELQRGLEDGDTASALHTLNRSLTILRLVVSQIGVIETLTPDQFLGFRAGLGGSGFQSAQFREIEVVLGRRDPRILRRYPEGSSERERLERAMHRPCVFDSFLRYLAVHGHPVPPEMLRRDTSLPLEPSAGVRRVLAQAYRDGGLAVQLCERLLELDQVVQEWRYRHVRMVERVIGDKSGTGGSSGASYLRTTLFQPMFADLWAVRNEL